MHHERCRTAETARVLNSRKAVKVTTNPCAKLEEEQEEVEEVEEVVMVMVVVGRGWWL